MEKALLLYFQRAEAAGLSFTDEMVQIKAKEIRDELGVSEEELKVSSGWLDKFKERN